VLVRRAALLAFASYKAWTRLSPQQRNAVKLKALEVTNRLEHASAGLFASLATFLRESVGKDGAGDPRGPRVLRAVK